MNRKSFKMVAMVLVALFLVPLSAYALNTPTQFTSNIGIEGLGSFMFGMSYTASADGKTAELYVELTNTSPVDNSGYITAIAFTNPMNMITKVNSFSSTDKDFNQIGGTTSQNSISVVPYDALDFGASLSSDWLGGGKPQPGIAVGSTAAFTYQFGGTNLGSLGVKDFVNDNGFVVRFRGFADGGSDKVAAVNINPTGTGGSTGTTTTGTTTTGTTTTTTTTTNTTTPPTTTVVTTTTTPTTPAGGSAAPAAGTPEPATMILVGIGMGLAALKKARK